MGVGCRFPGGVESSAGLWDLAAAERTTAGPVPPGRWDAGALARVHDPELAERAGFGCFLEGDIWAWDPGAFSVAALEQRWVDPQFRVLMEVAWEAVEASGIPLRRMRGSRTGVYVGTYAPDNLFREARPVQDSPQSAYLFGNFTAGAAGRVAFSMDLRGPVMVISTHCSSGLVALDTACGALTLGECDTALAGAVLLMVSPETHYYEAPLLLSHHGACFAFDARADGYVRGEGAGVLVLKRLEDARREGDSILAVIRGSAVNNDGQATRLTAPSTQLQQQLFRETVAKAQIDPGEVGLVEAHGPGTAVGDPIEYASIDAVYGRGRGHCALGSVKTNIGHSEPVSGIAGTIKAIESLRRGAIPPNATFQTWNRAIVREEASRLFVPTTLTRWPVEGKSRLAAVCSYGVTGTNAHVILESASARRPRAARSPERDTETRLFLLSGSSAPSLSLAARRLARWLRGDGKDIALADVAHTLAVRRSHAEHRVGIVAAEHTELIKRAVEFAERAEADGVVSGTPVLPPQHAGPVFVFTGQGSQRFGMCADLLAHEPTFAAAVDEIEPLVNAEAGFSVREMITCPERLQGLARIQPTLFAVQVALAAVWRSWGIEPAAVIGQSLGEVAAVVVAGGLELADGVKVICRRSALLAEISGGAMASVLADADQVLAAIEAAGAHGVSLGVLTSPEMTVISGDATQIAKLISRWEGEGVVAKLIDVDVASHSPQVDPILVALGAALADIPTATPRIPFYSTVSDDPRCPGAIDGDYWVRNQRDTVRFHAAVSTALAAGHRLFIEATPHPLAVRPILDTAAHDGVGDVVAVGSLREGTVDRTAMLSQLAAVHVAGYDGVDFATHYGEGVLADVPGTAWHRTRHGGDQPSYQLVDPALPAAGQHPMLGGYVHDPDNPQRHLWQTPLSPTRLPWLGEHRVADVPVLPGTGAVEMMLAAAVRIFGTDRVSVREVVIGAPVILDPEPVLTTRATRDGERASVEIVSVADGATIVHAHGIITAAPNQGATAAADGGASAMLSPEDRGGEWVDAEPAELHRIFRERHNVFHGTAFTAIDRIQVHPIHDRALATVRTHESARVSASTLVLHPALADEVVQSAVAAWLAHYTLTPGPVVVTGFDEVTVYGPTGHTRLVAIELHDADDLGCTASAKLATAEGTILAEIRGLRVANITSPADRFAARLSHLEWIPEQPAQPRTRATDRRWVVLTGPTVREGWSAELTGLLDQETAGCLRAPIDTVFAEPSLLAGASGVVLAIDTTGSSNIDAAATYRAVGQAISLIQCLVRRADPTRLWIVWRCEPSSHTIGSALRAAVRSANYEHPEHAVSTMDFTAQVALTQIVTELLDTGQPITEITLTAAERRIARIVTGPDTDERTGPELSVTNAENRTADADHTSTATPVVVPGGSYLVTGALGGLGLLTVDWLARRGAGRIVVNGRSAPGAHAEQILRAARDSGVDIIVINGDIADPALTQRAIMLAELGGSTLRGVIHAAGVVEDATITTLEPVLLHRVWRGKAQGAATLHRLTENRVLDFFVVFSSVASLLGSPGQTAYSAANGFLDGLVTARRHQGLPATGIHWGAWARVGRGQHLGERGFATIAPTDGIDALERIICSGTAQVAYSPLDINQWIAPYPVLRTSTLFAELLPPLAPDEDGESLRERLHTADGHSVRTQMLQDFIIETLRDLLGGTDRHIGAHTSIVMLGVDSLGAVQLQQRLQRALATEMRTGVIWVKLSPAALTEWLLDHLGLTTS
ncbi:type I polyketide synthase [Nocardia ninae]|uniref:type I polyketide synthase n=1 Tax=Nocardia ninae TaxID=356145 RepID=UPI001649B247|nr:type I polyketide synthase [Nocardia ninae]